MISSLLHSTMPLTSRPDKLPCLTSLDHLLLHWSLTSVTSLIPESLLMEFGLVRCWVTLAQCSAEWQLRFPPVERSLCIQRCDLKQNNLKLCFFLIFFIASYSKQYCVLFSITFHLVISPVYFMSSHLIFEFDNLPIRMSACYDFNLTYFIISPKLGLLAVIGIYIKGSYSCH